MSINHHWFISEVAKVEDVNEDIQTQSDETESSYQSSLQPSASGKFHFHNSHFYMSSIYGEKLP